MDARLYSPEADAGIVAWRTLCFMRMGFREFHATSLALRRDVDREHVERLVREGCSVGLILDIVL